MKKRLVSLMALALCLALCGGAVAQTDFPTKEITYLCGYGAGGSSDIQARLMQPYAEEYFGQPMVVENLGGAGGCTALTDFNSRAADGYTISSFNTTPLLKYVMGQTDFDYFEVFDFLACVITRPSWWSSPRIPPIRPSKSSTPPRRKTPKCSCTPPRAPAPSPTLRPSCGSPRAA